MAFGSGLYTRKVLYKKRERERIVQEEALRKERLQRKHLSKSALDKTVQKALLPSERSSELYRLMKTTHNVFKQAGITYWLDGGSLLGAVRNRGIIPTDDDIDICIFARDETKLLRLKKAFRQKACRLYLYKGSCGNYEMYKVESQRVPFLWLDVLLVKTDKEGNIRYTPGSAQKAWSRFYHHKDDVFPLNLVPFGPLKVWAPHNPYPYLDRAYGEEWVCIANIWNHKIDGCFSVSLERYPELRKPAPWDPKLLK